MFGVWNAAWPLIRSDLGLSYVQVGLLLAVPQMFASVLEPPLGLLGDAWDRRALVRGGGIAFVGSLLLVASSHGFGALMLALMIVFPASGAFVSLSQASLMDLDPARHELNMARWVLAGSLGVTAGPIVLGTAAAGGFGWRLAVVAAALVGLLSLALLWRFPMGRAARAVTPAGRATGDGTSAAVAVADGPEGTEPEGTGPERGRSEGGGPEGTGPLGGGPEGTGPEGGGPEGPALPALLDAARDALRALRRPGVLRWLALIHFADLMLDVFLGFLALYYVDVVGAHGAHAALVVVLFTVSGLVGDALAIPLLRRVDGVAWVRASAGTMLLAYPAFLIVDGPAIRLPLLVAVSMLTSGWYAVLKGRLYTEMPGRSATVMALDSLSGTVGGLLPLAVGAVAQAQGLPIAMWLLVAGPVALLVGLPRR